MRPRFGFKCELCGSWTKLLFNCDLKWDGKVSSTDSENQASKSVDFKLCGRCMRKRGLIEKKKEEME